MSAGGEGAVAQQYGADQHERIGADALPPQFVEEVSQPTHEPVPPRGGRPVLAGFLILLTLAWLAACGITLYQTWETASLVSLMSWIATICVPLALIALVWLVFGRTGRSETEKFTRAVAAMRAETESLDRVLGIVAERLSANRSQLSDDAARLMKLGEEASDRLGRVTHYLSREADGLQARSQAVEAAAAQARVDLGVLLTDLPQAEQAARSFSDTMREAGVSAHERARALEAQLSAVAARAQDADAATGGAAERLSAHIARIESSAGIAAQQLDGATARLDAAVDAALGRTSDAVEATRSALDVQAQAMLASVEHSRARFAEAGADAARQLNERLEELHRALAAGGEQLFAAVDESHVRLTTSEAEAARLLARRMEETQSALAAQNARLLAAVDESSARFADSEAEAARRLGERVEETQRTLAGHSERLFATIEAQREQLFATVEEGRSRFAAIGTETAEQIGERLESARQLVERISAGIAGQEQASQALISRLGSELASLDERLAALGQRTEGQSAQMATALAELRDATATLRREVDASTQEAAALVGRAGEMAGAFDQVAVRLRDELPPVLADVETRAAAMRDAALAAVEPVQALQATAADGAGKLAEADALVARSRGSLEALLAGIDGGVAHIDQRLREIRTAANEADSAASLLVRETGPELVETLVRVREAARAAAAHAREAIMGVIPESAASLSEAARQALGTAVTDGVRQQMAELEGSAQRAAAAARTASERLTRQLLALGEGAAALEARINEERAQREEQERGAMPRRVALLIESLNSTAIDVTKILSNDVTDTAWQAYLKGDRGVFTRRAVRLLDSGEAREIQRHYDQEPEFHEQVNRYIADFEAMLRRVLADGDGNSLAVTLLSSDMGKLYVALAQAIQHLRV